MKEVKMIKIADFLQDYNKLLNRGSCKVCGIAVTWNRAKLGSHKRANCVGVTAEEAALFCKQTPPTSNNVYDSDASMNSEEDAINNTLPLTAEKIEEINTALAKWFFRTGLPFRVLDSEAFRYFVYLLNPAYASEMPKSRALSGVLLDKEYSKGTQKLEETLKDSKDLVLFTDGWTNCRGDHIVNFLVKAPSQPSVFYTSVTTTGIIQNGNAVAAAIGEVVEKLGPEKFSSLVSDNAPVMKAAWKILEEKYPNISAFGCAAHVLNLLVKDILEPHSSGKFSYYIQFLR